MLDSEGMHHIQLATHDFGKSFDPRDDAGSGRETKRQSDVSRSLTIGVEGITWYIGDSGVDGPWQHRLRVDPFGHRDPDEEATSWVSPG